MLSYISYIVVCQSVCLTFGLSVCLSACCCVYPSVRLYVRCYVYICSSVSLSVLYVIAYIPWENAYLLLNPSSAVSIGNLPNPSICVLIESQLMQLRFLIFIAILQHIPPIVLTKQILKLVGVSVFQNR